ncbi:cation transport protein-domain-containing protein [Mycena floridula]|nr:cation transport protein-domain-containing protein [Mycena floridula]
MLENVNEHESQGHLPRWLRKNLNFYRVHIIFFTFTPLFFSLILFASNGQFKISYIDSLFISVSSMTVCGLATVDLSGLTGWQQVILFIQMCLGSPVVVSWVMVYLRRYYFAKRFAVFKAKARAEAAAQAASSSGYSGTIKASIPPVTWPQRIAKLFCLKLSSLSIVDEEGSDEGGESKGKKFRANMIKRLDEAPQRVNPSGWVSGTVPASRRFSILQSPDDSNRPQLSFAEPQRDVQGSKSPTSAVPSPPLPATVNLTRPRRVSDPGEATRPSVPVQRFETIAAQHSPTFPRTQTIEFSAPQAVPRRSRADHTSDSDFSRPDIRSIRAQTRHVPLSQHLTNQTHKSMKHSDFGGFPMPHELVHSFFSWCFPKLKRQLTRTVTIPRTTTIASMHSDNPPPGAKHVSYITFKAEVGRNSTFGDLTTEDLEELGGVEYRALNALLWIVGGYHICVHLLAFVVIAPYMSLSKWKQDFLPPALHKPVHSTWFSLFQVVSAYTNTGTSLVDTSMVPFQKAYPMIVVMGFLVLAGNTCFPIFLRFTIWILSKLVPAKSRISETLHFLLDHPRRCFIYLFPSHQTWFLLTIVLTLNLTDWFFFMVLDIGNPAIESISLGVRFIIGLLQAIAVRAAGFGTVSLSSLAPGVKVLYVIMMYISVYPIAMSVRSTNVYEEQSLGVFKDDDDEEEEHSFQPVGPRVTVWSRYLTMHARKQLAFDMWWLGLALFLVCIIERADIDKPENALWLNIFSIIFELVSAYGTVGLSLGIPTQNYSLSGALRPLSKLIICLVMIRGRHRGLPVAIDRAVILPQEFDRFRNQPVQEASEGPDRPNSSTWDESFELRQRAAVRHRSREDMIIMEDQPDF